MVQSDWLSTAEGKVKDEKTIALIPHESKRLRRGRMDLFVNEEDGLVVVVEIKATNWDRIKHVRKALGSHRRQIWRYIEKYLDDDGIDVSAGVIYPRAPRSQPLKSLIESYMADYGVSVVWYEEP